MFRTYLGAQSGVYRLEGEQLIHLGCEEHAFGPFMPSALPKITDRNTTLFWLAAMVRACSAAPMAARPGRRPIRA